MRGKRLNWKFFLIVTLAILLISIIGAVHANNGLERRSLGSSGISSYNSDSQESGRFIVKLKEESGVRGKLSVSSNANAIRAEIANLGGGNKVKHDFGSSFSATLSSEEVQALRSDGRVESVTAVKIFHTFLQDSVKLVNASNSFLLQVNGINLTGSGQTICIIDTGVNYTHSDLGGCYGNNSASSSCKVIGGWDYCSDNTDCTTEDSDPMDVNGHGTHVSGIAAANGNITGVAPDARIIMIKAGNSSGVFYSDDLFSAINWCVNNATKFNISVISMSLGGSSYTSYCDSDYNGDDSPIEDNIDFASAINSAASNNISVVAASGNNYSINAVAFPGCIENSTPVGSTPKSDSAISSFSNTWNNASLLMVVAPGESINSTNLTHLYAKLSGTSMSTPHVAGAIAIIRQFLNLTGQSRSSAQIENTLNYTGKVIDDSSASGRNFSRIDIYNAINILSFNDISLISPSNNTITKNNQTFSCNVSSNSALVNLTFNLFNSSSLEYTDYVNISNLINSSTFSYNFTDEGSYKWNCLAINSLNFDKISQNYTLTYDITPASISVLSPVNNSIINAGRFNVTLGENGSCLYSLDEGAANYSFGSPGFNLSIVNNTLIQDQSYNAEFYCNDSAGNKNYSTGWIFSIDLTAPNVSLISPEDGYEETASSTEITFSYNASDNLNISSCSVIVNGAVSATNSTINQSLAYYFRQTLSADDYSWYVNCTDSAGNTGNSSTRSLTISSPSSGGGGRGGGGGITTIAVTAPQTIVVSEAEMQTGTTKELKSGDVVQFNVQNSSSTGSEKHSMTVNSIFGGKVDITIRSDPVNISLSVGESAKLNLTSPYYYDIFVRLDNITNGKAKITLQTINEPISRAIATIQDNSSSRDSNLPDEINHVKESKVNKKIAVIAVLATIVIIVVFAAVLFFRNKKKRKK